jgi:hypothetical protein
VTSGSKAPLEATQDISHNVEATTRRSAMSRQDGWRHVAPRALVLGVVGALLGVVGYYPMFSQFRAYDDEGDWLLSLQQFSMHGGLYSHTYSQCGPFYYEVWTSLFKIFGLHYTIDTSRLVTLSVWVSASVLFGVAMWIWTQRVAIAVLVELFTFLLLYNLVFEPMEPAGLAYFLLGVLLVGVALFARDHQRLGSALVGVAVAALLLTKVNIGIFAVVSLLVATLVCWPASWGQLGRKVVALFLVFLTCAVLMQSIQSELWVRWFFAYFCFSVAGVGVCLLSRRTTDTGVARSALGLGGICCVVTGIVACLLVLLNGTSASQLIDGALLSQRNLAKIYQVSPRIDLPYVTYSLVAYLLALVVALLWRRANYAHWFDSQIAGVVRIAVATWMFWTMLPRAPIFAVAHSFMVFPLPQGKSFLLAAPLAWMALVAPRRSSHDVSMFARVAVVLFGVVGCLEAFPVAGSQLQWAALGLVPVAALCLWDGLTLLRGNEGAPMSELRHGSISKDFAKYLAWLVMASLLLLAVWNPVLKFSSERATYNGNVALSSPGAHLLRLNQHQQQPIDAVASYVTNHCSMFESLPGLNSFYFLSGEAPPTGLNTTQWMNLLNAQQQNEVLAKLKATPHLCVIEDRSLVTFWDQNRPLKQTRLVVFLETKFSVVKKVGPYLLLQRI